MARKLNEFEELRVRKVLDAIQAGGFDQDFKPGYGDVAEWARTLGIACPEYNDWEDMGDAMRNKWFSEQPWLTGGKTQRPPKPAEKSTKESGVQFDVSKVTAATIVNYRMDGADPILRKYLDAIAAIADTSVLREVKQALASLMTHMAGIDDNTTFGLPQPLTSHEYSLWEAELRGEVHVVGPLRLWKLLKRADVAYEYVGGISPYIKYTHNGKELMCQVNYQVAIDEHIYDERHAPYVAGFLDGVKHAGKQIKFEHVDFAAYMLAQAFLTKYKAERQGKVMKWKVIVQDQNNSKEIPLYPKATMEAFEAVLQQYKVLPFFAKDADETIDKVAMLFQKVHGAKIHELVIPLNKRMAELDDWIVPATELFDKIQRQPGKDKSATLKKVYEVSDDITTANKCLDKSRLTRNESQEGQYLNKGSASVHASNFDPWMDTTMKGKMIVDYIQTDLGLKSGKQISVYGVAYGHMSETLMGLTDEDNGIKFYDLVKARGSPEVFQHGNVFDHAVQGGWVIDDTNSHKVKKGMTSLGTFSGDHLKIKGFIDKGAEIIISKVSTDNFGTLVNIEDWKRVLSTAPGAYYRLVKFGKLHNKEAFVIIVRAGVSPAKLPATSFELFAGDIKTVAICMQLADKAIMAAQKRGVRFACIPHTTGGKYSRVLFWAKLVAALPTTWKWYLRADTFKFSGGSANTLDSSLENAEFVEMDDDSFFTDNPFTAPSSTNWANS